MNHGKDEAAFPSGMDDGMTLRDYFAAKAMQGAVVNASVEDQASVPELARLLAVGAYQIADAMLKERSK